MPLRISLVAIVLGCLIPAFSTAQDRANLKVEPSIKAQIIGKLEFASEKEGSGALFVKVKDVVWHLKLSDKLVESEKWQPLVGRSVLASGKIEIAQGKDGDKSPKTRCIVHVDALTILVTPGFADHERSEKAWETCVTLDAACKLYCLNVGRYPHRLDDLVVCPNGMTRKKWKGPYLKLKEIPLDPWGNWYEYDFDMNTGVKIVSHGPDGVRGSEDDITNSKK